MYICKLTYQPIDSIRRWREGWMSVLSLLRFLQIQLRDITLYIAVGHGV